jgi:hypothetical protein
MADGQYYAFSRISAGEKIVNPGDKVSASDLGVDKDEWDKLVDEGVVRTDKFPEVKGSETPSQAYLREAQEGMDKARAGQSPSKPDGTKQSTPAKEVGNGGGSTS